MEPWELSQLRKSFIIIPIVVFVLVCACRLFIGSVAGGYDMVVRDDALRDVTLYASNVSITPTDMASVERLSRDEEGYPVISLRAQHPGQGQVMVHTGAAGTTFEIRVEGGPILIVNGVNFTGWRSIALSVTAVFAITTALCIRAATILFRRSWYGYEMVIYVGGALFCLVETLSLLFATTSTDFFDFAYTITAMADEFVALTFLPMLIAALLVCVSNVFLIRYEGLRPVNLLGIAASIVWGAVNVILLLPIPLPLGELDNDLFWFIAVVDSVLAIIVAFGETLLVSTCICSWLASRHVPSRPRDCVIVLGCGTFPDGTPTPLLKGRIEAAVAFADRQREEGLESPVFVMSGGQGPDEIMSEAESMANHLRTTRPETSRILVEDQSTSTAENMRLSAELIAHRLPYARLFAFATTNYHVFRGYVCAHDAGLRAEGISAPTKPYFWPNAFLREVIGLIASRAPQIAVALIIVGSLYLAAEYAIFVA